MSVRQGRILQVLVLLILVDRNQESTVEAGTYDAVVEDRAGTASPSVTVMLDFL